jgi:cell division transport system permease protein
VQKESRTIRSRLFTSYLTSIISNTLVLFLIGLVLLLLFNTKKLSDYVRENIGFSVMLNDNVREAEILKLQKNLDAKVFVKSTQYISKDKAAQDLQKDLGEDFVQFLGYNPLLPSIDLKLKADYTNPDSINLIEKDLLKNSQIKEVFYQKSLLHLVHENVRKISLIILGFSGLLLLIALVLINNTIRLSVYSKRFVINTMQLVGATDGFIRKPFLLKSMLNGIYAAFMAAILLILVVYYAQKQIGDVLIIKEFFTLGILLASVFAIGIFLNLVSTFMSVTRYLRMKIDDLYI